MSSRVEPVPSLPLGEWTGRVGMIGFVVMAGAQIAVPLSSDDRALTTAVLVGFAVASFGFAAHAWGWGRATAAFVFVVPLTLALERLGSTSGFPFGDYHYSDDLQPQMRDVPVVVPVAWFAMGVPALEIGRRISSTWLGRAGAAALALTAWDVFLDPQMVEEGYWVWADGGWYRDIPWTNYAGWLGSSFLLLAALDRLIGSTRTRSVPLRSLYTWWTVMNTIGFLVFFGDPLVGVAGGVAMGTMTTLAYVRSVTE